MGLLAKPRQAGVKRRIAPPQPVTTTSHSLDTPGYGEGRVCSEIFALSNSARLRSERLKAVRAARAPPDRRSTPEPLPQRPKLRRSRRPAKQLHSL
jgi:hypothetical protein